MSVRLGSLMLALLVAGCAGPDPDGPGLPPAPDARPTGAIAWGLAGCAFVIVSVPVDPAALAPHVPEGFAPAPGRLDPLRASIELDAYRCDEGRWGDATLPDMSYGSVYVPVEPTAERREEGYGAYFVKWDPLVADEGVRARLVAAGLPAHAGDAQVAIAGGGVSASLGYAGGAGGFSIEGAVGALEPQGAPLPFMEFTPLEDGRLATWRARLHDAEIGQGAGVVELGPGWVREVVGMERAPATFIAGAWNVDQADVRLP